jgi:tetratricopeptide (TPR) repeat protein
LITLAVAHSVAATENDSLRGYILKGLEYSYSEDYDGARSQFEVAKDMDPADPSGYFFLCGLYGLYMNDFSTDEVDGVFLVNLLETIEKARERIEADSSDGWAHFYLGGAYAYRAYREYERSSRWKALSYALTAVGELKTSVLLDSTIYDAYMGIGSYHYFVNQLWSYVPFLGRDAEKGINEIKLAALKGTFVNVAAKEGLVHILLREKKYDEALALAGELLSEYPNSRTFRWTAGKVREEREEWELAASVYSGLMVLIEEGQLGNYYNLACCGERLAFCLCRMGEEEEARRISERMLELVEPPYEHRGVEKLRKDLQHLLADMEKAGK